MSGVMGMTFAQRMRLKDYLKTTCNYNDKEIKQAVAAIENMTAVIREKLFEFLVTGKADTFVVENVTVNDLMEKLGMNPITAFLSLDYLYTEPEEAKYILSQAQERLEIGEL